MKIKHGLCSHMTSDPSDPDDNSCGRVTCSGLISFPWGCKGGEEGRESSNTLAHFGFPACMATEIYRVPSLR